MRSFGNWDVWGSSYRMTEFQAAVGSVQLRRLPGILARRIELAALRFGHLQQRNDRWAIVDIVGRAPLPDRAATAR